MAEDAQDFSGGYPEAGVVHRLADARDLQRAVVAYRFWYPTVSVEGIFNGNRQIGVQDNRAMGIAATTPRQVGFTLNSDTPYGAATLDLADGPMVVELPPGPYIGLVDDHHQRWVIDLGLPGPDGGKGGRHVVLPSGSDASIPDGCYIGRSDSNKVLLAVRALPLEGDIDKAMDALRAVRIYPLASIDSPALMEIVDVTTHDMDSTCLAWEDGLDFWRVLHAIVDAEPLVDEFRPMYGLLGALGIGKGQPFAPDERMESILMHAAEQGRNQMLVAAFASSRADRIAWPDRRWEWVGLVDDNGDFETSAGLDLEARDRWFAQAIIASPAMFRRQEGSGSLYWLGVRDGTGAYLDGGSTYKITIPQPVPAKLFWSITLYDAQTRSQVQTEQGYAALRSLFELRDSSTNEDLDLWFGPTAPAGSGARWIQTTPGRGWFAYIRIYGPEPAAFDGAWRPGDFEMTESLRR